MLKKMVIIMTTDCTQQRTDTEDMQRPQKRKMTREHPGSKEGDGGKPRVHILASRRQETATAYSCLEVVM